MLRVSSKLSVQQEDGHSTHLVTPCLRYLSSPVSACLRVGWGEKEAREKTELELSYPTAQRPAISPGYCLGPRPKTSSYSLRSAPARARDGIAGTAGLSARKLLRELRAAGRGSGKLATSQRDEGEAGEGEARPPAFRSRLRVPELERRRSPSRSEDAAGASGTAMRLGSGSAPAAGGAASPPRSHSAGRAADRDPGVQPGQPSPSPSPAGPGCCGLALQGRPAAARSIPSAELPIRRRVHGGVEVELLGLLEGCFVLLGEQS